jgi:hypothetical protein
MSYGGSIGYPTAPTLGLASGTLAECPADLPRAGPHAALRDGWAQRGGLVPFSRSYPLSPCCVDLAWHCS